MLTRFRGPWHGDVDASRDCSESSRLSETVAVALISAERLHTVHPILEETLKTILADEVQHARFGWTLLDEVSADLTTEMRRRLGDYPVPASRACKYELDNPPAAAPSEAGEAVGLLHESFHRHRPIGDHSGSGSTDWRKEPGLRHFKSPPDCLISPKRKTNQTEKTRPSLDMTEPCWSSNVVNVYCGHRSR